MESAKMGKCGCGPFNYTKRKYLHCYVLSQKVFLLCDTNASKMGRNFVSKNHANASWNATWTEYIQYLRRRTEKQWHNISRCFGNWHTRYELESSSDCWIDFICCVTAFQNFDPSSHSRARHWIDTVDLHFCDNTYQRYYSVLSFCVSLMDQNSIYSLFTSVTLHCAYSTE